MGGIASKAATVTQVWVRSDDCENFDRDCFDLAEREAFDAFDMSLSYDPFPVRPDVQPPETSDRISPCGVQPLPPGPYVATTPVITTVSLAPPVTTHAASTVFRATPENAGAAAWAGVGTGAGRSLASTGRNAAASRIR